MKRSFMENSNGIIIGLLALVCLIMFALMLHKNMNPNPTMPIPQPQIQQPAPAPQQPQQPQQPHRHCPPPVCPPDCILEGHKILYNMGYMDAACGRRPNSLYRTDPMYMRGYRDGAPHCPPNLKLNIIID
jgi:hypothetical protein